VGQAAHALGVRAHREARSFTDPEAALNYVATHETPVVVKAADWPRQRRDRVRRQSPGRPGVKT